MQVIIGKTVRPVLSNRCPVCLSVSLSVCDVGVLWPTGWMAQDEIWHAGRPQSWPYCVRSSQMSVVAKQLDGSRCHLIRR